MDFCVDQNVKGYPTIRLYRDGVFDEEELSSRPQNVRELAGLKEYIDGKIMESIKVKPVEEEQAPIGGTEEMPILVKAIDERTVEQKKENSTMGLGETMAYLDIIAKLGTEPNPEINPDGRVLQLSNDDFFIMTNNTPWFVFFYTPWCEHCRPLHGLWASLAPALKGHVNVAKVDCSVNTKIQKYYGIRGFPTIKFLREPGPAFSYEADKTFDSLKNFALRTTSQPGFKVIKGSDIRKIISSEEVSFYFLYDPNSMDQDIMEGFRQIALSVRSIAKVYVSPDPAAYAALGVTPTEDNRPIFIASRDNGRDIVVYSGTIQNTLPSRQYARQFIVDNRQPLLPQLAADNQDEILGSDRLVVMVVVDPLAKGVQDRLEVMKETARTWAKREGDEKLYNLVTFAWMDGVRWRKYVRRAYGLGPKNLPAVVIADLKNDVYYDTDSAGYTLPVDQVTILNSIDDILNGKGRPRYTTGLFSNSFRSISQRFAAISLFIGQNFFLFVFAVLIGVWVCFSYGFLPSPSARGGPKAE
ncbi:hypothetical protein HK097_007885 [Rhizophlyctis rosea]|uniref:Thioredoxin domain-containing protein n=1 Tax=Rhizophlyctis rosea TaxID=64517 RepID=A0AAD5SJ36_9FUNG|nr:hypothetical protein HK097_007885 [Rhizophlyctis rosea]